MSGGGKASMKLNAGFRLVTALGAGGFEGVGLMRRCPQGAHSLVTKAAL